MAKHLIIYFGLCLFLSVSVKAQISHGGRPLPLTATKSLTEDLFITMPPFDLAEQLRLDSLEATGLRSRVPLCLQVHDGLYAGELR